MGKPMLEAQESPPFEKPSIEQVIKCILCRERETHTRKHTHTQNIHEKHELNRNLYTILQLSPAHVFAHGTLTSKYLKLNLCCFKKLENLSHQIQLPNFGPSSTVDLDLECTKV